MTVDAAFPLPEWLDEGPAVMAHRGGASLGEENSVEVLSAAVDAGAHAVEIDVQELADGTIVLFHDAHVIDGEHWRWVRELDVVELASLVGPVVDLDELLRRLIELPDLGLYLEIKAVSPAGVDRAVERVVAAGVADRTVIGSFRHDVPAQVARDGRVAASALFRERFNDPLALALDLGCQVVHPCFDGDDWALDLMRGEWLERLHDACLKVVGWNANSIDVLTKMADIGLDVVCTDDPRLYRS